ncbi:8-oxo-dGTP diphosphatase MutT [Brumicola nitratireducens]|uniref:8-oxo-dGTP diphosphatase n=1 Tax=Glaciecola nitratireducens (strain JCM 12485 / KCTC 12276 / FR1064) TaxID=1085623 RepID=G4QMD2_GLANF|nr:8-oxo-dGTP diphosphatase MutT [Glaciecola nitratireducens]AEP30784.1 7,8-dihydro-8-oxoguanine-triphosphatase, prefers dGTP [Glaciecola nitratireducens FR1064]
MKQVHVAVGVVRRGSTFFICKRADDQHQGGKWEFPGGKVELGETVEQALNRELYEEIDISIKVSSPLIEVAHEYTDKRVLLSVLLVDEFNGEPFGKEGQMHRWADVSDLKEIDFPDANIAIVDAILALSAS